jgi:hypothetical protein
MSLMIIGPWVINSGNVKINVQWSKKVFVTFCGSGRRLQERRKKTLCILGCPWFRFDEFGIGFVVPFH